MFKKKSCELIIILVLACGTPVFAVASQLEQGLIRLYFGIGAAASSENFECLDENQIQRLDQEIAQMKERALLADQNTQVMLNQGLRLTTQYIDSITCGVLNDFGKRLQGIEAESDTEYAEFLAFAFGRELMLEMIGNASIDTKMMTVLSYGSPDVLGSESNEILYQMSRDQIEFSLALLNDYDIGIDMTSFYTYLLERAEALEAPVESNDSVYLEIRPSISEIYRKMGMTLLRIDAQDGDANYIEAIIKFTEGSRQHLQSVNYAILSSLPDAI